MLAEVYLEGSAVMFSNLVLLSAVLKVKAVDRGVVVIEGTEAGRYLAMSDEGRLYGSVSIYKTLNTSSAICYECLITRHYTILM